MGKRRSSGEGTIYFWNAKKLWVAKITLPDGTPRKKTSKKQSVVKEWLLEERKKLSDGIITKPANLTLEKFFTEYLDIHGRRALKPSTFQSYERFIKLYILPSLGYIKLKELKTAHLDKLYGEMLTRGLSDRTVEYTHGIIHRALNKAITWQYLTVNVADLASAPKYSQKEPSVWSAEEVKRFLASIKDDRFFALYVTACGTGMREGEILGLAWKSVDLTNGMLQVTQTVTYIVGVGLVLGTPKSKKSRRPIALPSFVVDALAEHKEKQAILKQSDKWQENGLVFTTNVGTPISPRNLVRHFKTKLAEAGLPDIRFHELRHSVASILLAQNKHPKVVQELLGHSTITLTLNTYSHIIPSLQRDAADALDEILS